jgi:hypothetical protein
MFISIWLVKDILNRYPETFTLNVTQESKKSVYFYEINNITRKELRHKLEILGYVKIQGGENFDSYVWDRTCGESYEDLLRPANTTPLIKSVPIPVNIVVEHTSKAQLRILTEKVLTPQPPV